ncbi:hypothetical protein CEP51_000921 [Fusarium floridanum]|uniref:2,5-diamino-6-ribosylamino-4(3H)-pyrimidinone 5'-phosphate reductase n=1 Tax=Fusarium floridanum TaxID=1325733 RepID=A0A428SJW9_9HYPO|nr:hypothetical protein CEP51_000921 [Fusarium floridanum]
MPQLRYNVATSLDGYIASPDGSADWNIDDSTIDFDALYEEFDFFVMGRKTYETMLSFGGPDENRLCNRPKENVIVASRSLKPEDFPGITILSTNVLEFIRQLKLGAGKDIWLMGGNNLATQCLRAGLVDTIEAAVMPVVLGEGIKLIDSCENLPVRLNLLGSERLESGIIMTSGGNRENCHIDQENGPQVDGVV